MSSAFRGWRRAIIVSTLVTGAGAAVGLARVSTDADQPFTLVEFDGSAHALNIFRTPAEPRLRDALLAFLRSVG